MALFLSHRQLSFYKLNIYDFYLISYFICIAKIRVYNKTSRYYFIKS